MRPRPVRSASSHVVASLAAMATPCTRVSDWVRSRSSLTPEHLFRDGRVASGGDRHAVERAGQRPDLVTAFHVGTMVQLPAARARAAVATWDRFPTMRRDMSVVRMMIKAREAPMVEMSTA